MKYDISCKFLSITFSKMLASYYKNHFKDVAVKPLIKDVKKEYKAMILRTPGLSKDNKMASNLKGAAYFFAMAKAIPDMTPALMDQIIDDSFKSPFMIKVKSKDKKKGTLFSEKEEQKMAKDALRSQSSNDEMDWTYTYDLGTRDETKYTITKCGVKRLAERENLLEYLPSMCKMDYPKYRLIGGELNRTKTLANGDECCNFDIKRIKE